MGSVVPIPITGGAVQTASDSSADDIVLMTAWDNAKTAQSALEDSHESDVGKSILGLANSLQAKADADTVVAWKAQLDDLNAKYDKAHTAFVAAVSAFDSQITQAIKKDGDAFQRAYQKMLAQLTESLAAEEKQEALVHKRIVALKELVETAVEASVRRTGKSAPKQA